MNKMSFVKGMGIGLMVGSVVTMAATPRKKHFHVSKALRSVGEAIDSVAETIGL